MKNIDIEIDQNGNLVCPKCKSSQCKLNIIFNYTVIMKPHEDIETWFKCEHCDYEDLIEKE